MLEHNFMQFWSFIISLASLGLMSSLVGIKIFNLIKARRAKAADSKIDAFTCTACKEQIKESDFDKQDASLFLALKKLSLCEPCLRGETRDKRNMAQKAIEAIEKKVIPESTVKAEDKKVIASSEDDKQIKPKRML